MKNRSTTIVVLCILGAIVYLALSRYQVNKEQRNAVTVYTNDGKGMSLYAEFVKKLSYGKVTIYRRPFLYPEELDKYDAIGIHSPRIPLSKKEAKTILGYLEKGGRVFLSAHDEETHKRFSPLLRELGVSFGHIEKKNDKFENFKTKAVKGAYDDDVFKSYFTYEFYSPLVFNDHECKEKEFYCFVRKAQVGKGFVYLNFGLPLHSNSLMTKGDNRHFAFQLAKWAPNYLFDEYHHLFPTKTLGDLLSDWKYGLPLIGLIIGTILFFWFSKNPNREGYEDDAVVQSLHEVGERVVVQHLSHPQVIHSANEAYKKYLMRQHPQWKEEIEDVNTKWISSQANPTLKLQRESRPILELHKRILRSQKIGEQKNDIHTANRSANP